MDKSVQSSFVLLNNDLFEETPKLYEEAVSKQLSMRTELLTQQAYLQDFGVSFSYTDTLSAYEREDLCLFYADRQKRLNEK